MSHTSDSARRERIETRERYELRLTDRRDRASFPEPSGPEGDRWTWASSGCFECEQCKRQELRCGPCSRARFCHECAAERAARSTKRAGAEYRRTERARELHRASSLRSYHRRGRERRRQRLAREKAARALAAGSKLEEAEEVPADDVESEQSGIEAVGTTSSSVSFEIQSDSVGYSPARSGDCLTHKTVGEAGGQRATVESSRAAPAWESPVSRSEEELVDAKSPPDRSHENAEIEAPATDFVRHCDAERRRLALGAVLTTAAAVRAALSDAREHGPDEVVVWGRCARCGRLGRVVHFDGELRARARAP